MPTLAELKAQLAAAWTQYNTDHAAAQTLWDQKKWAEYGVARDKVAADVALIKSLQDQIAHYQPDPVPTPPPPTGTTYTKPATGYHAEDLAGYTTKLGLTKFPNGHVYPGGKWLSDPTASSQWKFVVAHGGLPLVGQLLRVLSADLSGVTNGSQDATLTTAAKAHQAAAKALGRRFPVLFESEMDRRSYTGAQFTAAWNHAGAIFRQYAPNVDLCWNPTGYHPDRLDAFWPGSKYVDLVGFNPYQNAPSKLLSDTSQDASKRLGQSIAWAEAKGLGGKLCSPEYGVVEGGNGAAAAKWLDDANALFTKHKFVWVNYFASTGGSGDTMLYTSTAQQKLAALARASGGA